MVEQANKSSYFSLYNTCLQDIVKVSAFIRRKSRLSRVARIARLHKLREEKRWMTNVCRSMCDVKVTNKNKVPSFRMGTRYEQLHLMNEIRQ